jgi:alpha-tubulin suppressor-like RCC1 family protein
MPVPISGLAGFRAVAVGDLFTVALKRDGTVWTWGDNTFGQLGNNALIFRSTPSVVVLEGVEKIASGGFHALAIKSDGSVWSWGDSRAGQIGDGESVNRSSPVAVRGLGAGSAVLEISGGGIHSLALEAGGTVLSWGDNYSSQLGPREGSDTAVPSRIVGLTDVTAISAGGTHSVALRRDGTVWTWGHNYQGQLGDGTRSAAYYQGRLVPQAVAGVTGAQSIAAGGSHTIVLGSDGTLWGWGANGEGQLGDGTFQDRLAPVQVAKGLGDVVAIAAGDAYTLALRRDGTVWAWGANWNNRLGDGTGENRAEPVQVTGLDGAVAVGASFHSLALRRDGTVWAWGSNDHAQLGDGTLVDRDRAAAVLREGGAGSLADNDWFLDLDPAVANAIPADKVPVFLAVAAGSGADVTASIRYRAQDVGTSASTYVFAIAPASLVKALPGESPATKSATPPFTLGKARSRDGSKADTDCVLAQLTANGQLQGATPEQLQAALSGVLSATAQAVPVVTSAAAPNVAGATFFVGYGASGSAMLNGGLNRGVVSVPGAKECKPQAPQAGWWWNPLEDGRGFSLEVRGNNAFVAAFLYDITGRSTWYVSTGPVSLDGAYYSGDLLSARGGQTLGGAYPGFPTLASVGKITMAFATDSLGTITWPGGTVPIQRFNIVPNGLSLAPVAGQPESGWWWNEAEAGRGFFMEWQGGNLDIAGYMYDDAGNSVWYLTTGTIGGTPASRNFSGSWWSFGEGQTLTGAWKPNRRTSDSVAPVTIQFSAPDTALMTLPNGRTTLLKRHRF